MLENNGQILFSSEEIGRQLGYARPSKSINILFNRNHRELRGYAVGIKLMSTDGKSYEVRHFIEEGVYIISMLANTPRAREFRSMLAKLLREIRERRVALARESGYIQGMDEGRASVVSQIKEAENLARTEAAARVWRFGPVKKRRLRSAVRYRREQPRKQRTAQGRRRLGLSLLGQVRPACEGQSAGGGGMSAMCKVPVDVVDGMDRMESRIAFLGAAICAISELGEIDRHAQSGLLRGGD